MARDYEDIFRLDELNDDELRALVREQLAQYETVDADTLTRIKDAIAVIERKQLARDRST